MGKKAQGQGARGRGGGGGRSAGPGLGAPGPLACALAGAAVGAACLWRQWGARREAFSQSRMRDWLRQRGGLVDNVEIAMFDYPGGVRVRGCAAVRDIPAGSEVVSVPSLAMLSDFTIDPRVVTLVEASMGVESAHDPVLARDVALAAGLLRERHLGERSAFAEFMSSLPTPAEQPDNLPRWDDAQLAVLGSVLHKFVIWRRMMLNSLLDMVSQHGALLGHHAEEDCVWALSIVVSRQVHGMLMPLLDLANHASEPNAEMQHYDGGVRQVAKRDIARGEEVTITYGAKANLHLLQAYGFTLPSNSLSALSIDTGRLNASAACGPAALPLDHAAPLAVAPAAAACLRREAGSCAMLRVLAEECGALHSRLWPPEGAPKPLHAAALGIQDPRAALEALRARAPPRPADAALREAVEQELRTLQRCSREAQEELDAARLGGGC